MIFEILKLIPKSLKLGKLGNFPNCYDWVIWKKIKYLEFFYLNVWKINILQFEKSSNILRVQIISKKWKNTIIKLSKNSSFVILIFATLKFRNFSRSTFRRSKFWPPPKITNVKNYEKFNYSNFFNLRIHFFIFSKIIWTQISFSFSPISTLQFFIIFQILYFFIFEFFFK